MFRTLNSQIRTFSKNLTTSSRKTNGSVVIMAPAALATVVVVGLYNMKTTTDDITRQTHYGARYSNL